MEKRILELAEQLGVCQIMCNWCFYSCLKEPDVAMMAKCIKLDKECAEICGLALSQIASQSVFTKEVLKLCINACEECAAECRKHDNYHCRACAATCEQCAEACKSFI